MSQYLFQSQGWNQSTNTSILAQKHTWGQAPTTLHY